MIMSAIAILLVGASAYMWMLRGFFSGLIHLMCTVAAGAVAFAVMEPLALSMLKSAGDRGFVGDLQLGSAWAFALAGPFIVTYAILRGAIDASLRRNVFVSQAANYVGGGLCGALAGVIISGIAVMSVGMLRLPADMGLFDYRAVQIASSGSVQRGPALWLPTDRLTSWFYAHASNTVFYTDDNLATYYPAFYVNAGALRYAATNGELRARNTTRPGSFTIEKSYELVPPASVTGKARLDELTKDRFSAPPPGLTDFNGEPISPTSRLLGYMVNFTTPAREKTGQVIVVNAQVHLLATDENGVSHTIFPHAAVMKAAPSTLDMNVPANRRKEIVEFARFVFLSGGDGKAFPSVGGDSDAKFGFEFLVPANLTPKALYVKGIRADIASPKPDLTYATHLDRDRALATLFKPARVGALDESLVNVVTQSRSSTETQVVDQPPESFGFQQSIQIGLQFQKDQVQGLTLVPGRGGAMIQDGECRLRPGDTVANGLEATLKVDKYEPGDGVVICQLDVSMSRDWKIGERGFDNDKPVFLIDDKGNTYDAVGFFYKDGDIVGIRYTPGTPLKGMNELPKPLSRSEVGQQAKLIFRVTKGAVIVGMGIGEKTAIKWAPRFRCDANQK